MKGKLKEVFRGKVVNKVMMGESTKSEFIYQKDSRPDASLS
jgi:hypothetical protein